MLNCQNCQFDYFCCKLRVKTTFLERLKIRLKGYKNFIEKDPLKRKLLKFQNNQCIFLKNNQCQIYSIRPKPCRNFPFQQPCQDAYKKITRLRKKQLI